MWKSSYYTLLKHFALKQMGKKLRLTLTVVYKNQKERGKTLPKNMQYKLDQNFKNLKLYLEGSI